MIDELEYPVYMCRMMYVCVYVLKLEYQLLLFE